MPYSNSAHLKCSTNIHPPSPPSFSPPANPPAWVARNSFSRGGRNYHSSAIYSNSGHASRPIKSPSSVAADDTAIAAELDRPRASPASSASPTPHPRDGMFSSIRCAARWPHWPPGVTHWAIVLGDQPQLQSATIAALSEFSAQHPTQICQPARHGHGRHPVILPRNFFQALANSNAPTLKQFLQLHTAQTKLLELNDPGLDIDLDHPTDYTAALKQFSTKTSPPSL